MLFFPFVHLSDPPQKPSKQIFSGKKQHILSLNLPSPKTTSSHQEVSYKKRVLKNFTKFLRKHLCQLTRLKPATLSTKRLQCSCFPVCFPKFLNTVLYKILPGHCVWKPHSVYEKFMKKYEKLIRVKITTKTFRSSHSEVFLGKGVLKICSTFTGEHPCRSAISIKLTKISVRKHKRNYNKENF